MQVLKMYSVRDSKTEIFSYPFQAKTHGEAERNFQAAVQDPNPNNMLKNHPHDFDLWYIGEFDDQTGKINPAESPIHVAKAIQFAPKLEAIN